MKLQMILRTPNMNPALAADPGFISITELKKKLVTSGGMIRDREGIDHDFPFPIFADKDPDRTFVLVRFK